MKVSVTYANPEHDTLAQNLMNGFAKGAVESMAPGDGSMAVIGEIGDTDFPSFEDAFKNTNEMFANNEMILAKS